MDSILMRLIDRNDPGVSHDPLHVELSFTTDDIKQYLNSTLQRNGSYRFYVDGVVFNGILMDEIISRRLEVERGVIIEYESDECTVPDLMIEMEDMLMFLEVIKRDEWEVWCSTYGGRLMKYVYEDGLISLKESFEYYGIQGVACGDEMYIYNGDGEVMRGDGSVVLKVDGEISCISSSSGILSIGTDDGRCFVFVDELRMIHKFRSQVSSTMIRGSTVEFTCIDGRIGLFDISTGEFKKERIEQNITSMDSMPGTRVFGTSCSGVIVDEGERHFIRTNIRFSRKILMINRDLIAQVSQYSISILNIRDSRETRRITVDEHISDAGLVDRLLIVGIGSKIHGYFIK